MTDEKKHSHPVKLFHEKPEVEDTDLGYQIEIQLGGPRGTCYTYRILPRAYVKAAEEGDRKSIAGAAGAVAHIIERDLLTPSNGPLPKKQNKYLFDWITSALRRIQEGEEPNIAFGWKIPGGGRGRKGPSIMESLKRQALATFVLTATKDHGKSVEEAVSDAADMFDISYETAWKHYSEYKDKPIW